MATELGNFISAILAEKNINQKELCERTGISAATISRLLSGERGKNTSSDILNKLAIGLSMTSVD